VGSAASTGKILQPQIHNARKLSRLAFQDYEFILKLPLFKAAELVITGTRCDVDGHRLLA
jgi:hypothetical protein